MDIQDGAEVQGNQGGQKEFSVLSQVTNSFVPATQETKGEAFGMQGFGGSTATQS